MIKKILLILFFSLNANAALEVTIAQGKVEPTPIAITQIFGADSDTARYGNTLRQIINNNLTNSGLFYTVNEDLYIQSDNLVEKVPRFEDWKLIKAQFLLSADVSKTDKGIRLRMRLYDVFNAKEIEKLQLTIPDENLIRRVGHTVSDIVYERITGETGYFDTRIVYVSESGPQNKRLKRLAIMDQDGENHQYLTDGSFLVLTPRFSPTSQEITYLAYFKNEPRVYIFNLETGQQELLGSFPGMTFAPRFSPAGDKIIMSLAQKGITDIYTMNLNNQEVKRLTNSSAIDTSPSYSPDGKQIIFNSDRGGSQQIYIMDSNGKNIKRISFGNGRYATPVWAPKGELIAFTKMHKNKFYIGVMAPDGSGERLLAQGYLVEGPTWAPNGRVLMYFKQDKPIDDGKSTNVNLYKIDITGFRETRIITPSDGSDPAWSPLLPN